MNAKQICVNTKNSVVTLKGVVTNEQVKDMAEFEVWYVFGVNQAINSLAVQE